ncbi:hypothetical protein VTI74DRAFT_861 [Chaetomium olivicolor]
MALAGTWQYRPNANEPLITALRDTPSITRGNISACNQWTYLSINQVLQTRGGICVTCNLKLGQVSIVDKIVAVVSKPAVTGWKCSRAAAGIPNVSPIMRDAGGEGVLVVGYKARFPDAINVNDCNLQSSPNTRFYPLNHWPIPAWSSLKVSLEL